MISLLKLVKYVNRGGVWNDVLKKTPYRWCCMEKWVPHRRLRFPPLLKHTFKFQTEALKSVSSQRKKNLRKITHPTNCEKILRFKKTRCCCCTLHTAVKYGKSLKKSWNHESNKFRAKIDQIKKKSLRHTVRNRHFLSKNSTLISWENCRFFGVKNSWKCCGFGLFSFWQL